jgi:hypothetical protein
MISLKLIGISRKALLAGTLTCLAMPAVANVITDWDTKAVALVAPAPVGQRELAMIHVAMFDAVNSIERRYRPYLVQLTAPKTTSQEASAARGEVGRHQARRSSRHQDSAGSRERWRQCSGCLSA